MSYDGFDNSCDAMEDWHFARLDADMEMASMDAEARYYRDEAKAGRCHHMGAGVGYRETAFYPEQIGLSPGQTLCYDCGQVYRSEVDCYVCDLPEWHCGGVKGWSSDHTSFVTPPMVRVCNVSEK